MPVSLNVPDPSFSGPPPVGGQPQGGAPLNPNDVDPVQFAKNLKIAADIGAKMKEEGVAVEDLPQDMQAELSDAIQFIKKGETTKAKAQDVIAQLQNKDPNSLTSNEKAQLSAALQVLANAEKGKLNFDKTVGTTADGSSLSSLSEGKLSEIDRLISSLQGSNFDPKVVQDIVTKLGIVIKPSGLPGLLPPPGTVSLGASTIGEDIGGNSWFSNNFLIALRNNLSDFQKVNRDANLTLGEMEAGLVQMYADVMEEKAKLTEKSYDKQAEMAMYEMVGAAVSIGMSAAQMGMIGVGAGAGARSGFKGAQGTVTTPGAAAKPAIGDMPASAAVPEVRAAPTNMQKAGGAFSGGGKGMSSAAQSSMFMNGLSQGTSSFITNASKMVLMKELGDIERAKVHVEAEAELIKKAMDSISAMQKEGLDLNDQFRQMLKSVSEESARIFNWKLG